MSETSAAFGRLVEARRGIGLVLLRGDARGFAVAGLIGRRVDGGAGDRAVRQRVGMDGDHQRRLGVPGDPHAVAQRDEAVVVAGHHAPCSGRRPTALAARAVANCRTTSFSTVPRTPLAPGSSPPWPGSITTTGRPVRRFRHGPRTGPPPAAPGRDGRRRGRRHDPSARVRASGGTLRRRRCW